MWGDVNLILNNLYTKNNNTRVSQLIDTLANGTSLSLDEYEYILTHISQDHLDNLFMQACKLRDQHYSNNVYIRGLIEFSNVCMSDCYYCGIRHSADVVRYRLSYDEMASVVDHYYGLGYRSFVFQSGENPYESIDEMAHFLKRLKDKYETIALTLSIGEKSQEEYQALKQAGMDRFLLRHETACHEHFAKIHPPTQTLAHRLACAASLKQMGIQLGLGIMVNSPYQTNHTLAKDFMLLNKMQPAMIGIGPYLKSDQGILSEFESGDANQTAVVLALARLTCPQALLPSTTALGLCDPKGRIKGLRAGCNVVMINLTPQTYRSNYSLYNKDVHTLAEIEKNKVRIIDDIESCHMQANFGVGHHCQRSSNKDGN